MTRVVALIATAVLSSSIACAGTARLRVFPAPGRPSAVAVTTDLVWVADDQTHAVHVFDASSGETVGEPIGVSRNPIALASDGGSVWVGHAGGEVTRIDAAGRRAGEPIEAGGSITSIAVLGGSVWAADISSDALVEVDARSGLRRRTIEVEDGVVRVVAAGDRLWVTNKERTVTSVDPRSGEVGPVVAVGVGPIGAASDGRTLWVANSDDGTVGRVGLSSARRAGPAVDVGRGPVAVAVVGGSVWVAVQDDQVLARIDAESGRVSGDALELGFLPRGVVSGDGAVWVVGTNPGSLARVDP